MRFELNPKRFDDWVGLHKLLSHSFAYMDGIIDPPSSLYKLTPDDLRIKAEQQILLLIFDDQKIVGCAYFDIRQDVLYLGKIAIAKAHRGRGLAHKIIGYAIDLAKQHNKQTLELEIRIELTGNLQAFGKLGFITTAQNSHAGYDHTTSITMQLTLTG